MNIKLKILLFVIILFWNLGIFPGFFVSINDNLVLLIPLLNKLYSGVCHQNEIKLLEVFGMNTMVCSRCSGIYLGVLISSFFLIFYNVKRSTNIKYLYISAVPLVIDVISYNIKLYNYSKPAAFLTGLFLGSVGIYYFYIGLEKYFSEYKIKEKI